VRVRALRMFALLLALLCLTVSVQASSEYNENNPGDLRPNNLRAESAIVICC
jgi:hypothetical protein